MKIPVTLPLNQLQVVCGCIQSVSGLSLLFFVASIQKGQRIEPVHLVSVIIGALFILLRIEWVFDEQISTPLQSTGGVLVADGVLLILLFCSNSLLPTALVSFTYLLGRKLAYQ